MMSIIYEYYEKGVFFEKTLNGKTKLIYDCKTCKLKNPTNEDLNYGKYRCNKGKKINLLINYLNIVFVY